MKQQPIGRDYLEALKRLHGVPRVTKRREKRRPNTALISEAAQRKIAEREAVS